MTQGSMPFRQGLGKLEAAQRPCAWRFARSADQPATVRSWPLPSPGTA
jgi:hypothetical protein